jgi:sigma-B regulation protein RsbU (phosphoserine phosphatase)
MKFPSWHLSPRTIRILFTVSTLIVFGCGSANFLSTMVYNATGNDQCAWTVLPKEPGKLLISNIKPGGVADQAGIRDQDRLVAIDGKTFTTPAEAQAIINAVPSGEEATYTIERAGVRMDVVVKILKLFNMAYLGLFFLGLGFLIVGYVVVMTKPEGKLQRRFARYSIFAMLLFAFFGGQQQLPNFPWLARLFGVCILTGRLFAPVAFITFFFHFPVHLPNLAKRWVIAVLYATSALLLAGILLANRLTLPPQLIGFLFSVPYSAYLIGLGCFVVSYFRNVPAEKRPQFKPILIGAAIGGAAAGYIILLAIFYPFAVILYPMSFLPGLFVTAVPISFGYSIFRYRLMDIDLIVKRSLIYAMITAAVAAMYLVVVYGIGNVIAYMLGTEQNRLLNIVAFILIALAFDPIKRRTQDWVDRFFYQERYNYQRALLEFSQELPQQMNLEQILQSIVNRISGTMHVEKVAVVLCEETEGCASVTLNVDEACCRFGGAQSGLIELLRRRRAPQPLVFLGDDQELAALDPHDRECITGSGVVLAVPMFLKERMIGTINVGPKMSGRFYAQEDIDLLSTVASQAAIAIENARLHRSEIEKQRIEEEMNMARLIQQGLLPKENPVMPPLEVAGISIPALSVGGDYFDFIELSPKKLLLVVADVSGKGMSAALYMSKIQGMIQLAAHMYATPREMLVHVNRRLYDGIERKSFITMILALFDLDAGEVRLCRAGHNKAMVAAGDGLRQLDSGGIGLGLERGPIFERSLQEVTYPLAPGNVFFLYSDGLSEAMDTQDRQFGEEAIRSLIEKHKGDSAQGIQDAVLAAVRAFQGEADQHDDMTVVIAKVR